MEKTTPDTAASPTELSSTNNKYMDIKNMYKKFKKGVVSHMMIYRILFTNYFSIHLPFSIFSHNVCELMMSIKTLILPLFDE